MLGKGFHYPHGLEGNVGKSTGMRLLELEATLAPKKKVRDVSGTLAIGGASVHGCEIPAGVTRGLRWRMK